MPIDLFTSGFTIKDFNFSDNSSNEKFKKSGYDSINFDFVLLRKSIQCAIIIIAIILFYGFLQTSLRLICPWNKKLIQISNKNLVDLVLYGFLIWYLIENFMVFVVSFCMQITNYFYTPSYWPWVILSCILFGAI